jgi:translation initiation factor IF-3
LEDALAAARAKALDLVEVAPNSTPPVCRIMDYGRYKYQQEKRHTETRKSSSATQLKEIKLRPKTGEHDYQFKVKHMTKFIEKGHRVKATIMFRGREIVHPQIGMKILQRVAEDLTEIATVESSPRLEGRNMSMLLAPKKS